MTPAQTRRRHAAILSLLLGLAFVAPAVSLTVMEPAMGFRSVYDYLKPEMIRMGWESPAWRIADLATLAIGVLLPLLEANLRRDEGLGRDGERALAIIAGALFLVVGVIGFGVKGMIAHISEMSHDAGDVAVYAALVVRTAARDAAVFALGAMILWQGVSSVMAHAPVPRWIGIVGVFAGVMGLVFPFVMIPVPVAFALWFLLLGFALYMESRSADA